MGVKPKSQSIGEYVILVGVLVTALISMQAYLKRGIQSVVKHQADQMSEGKQYSIEFDPKRGFALGSETTADKNESRNTGENNSSNSADSYIGSSYMGVSSSWRGEVEHED